MGLLENARITEEDRDEDQTELGGHPPGVSATLVAEESAAEPEPTLRSDFRAALAGLRFARLRRASVF